MTDNRQRRLFSSWIFWATLGLVTAVRIIVAAKLNVCYDEGYYHSWSILPQLSYMDHPPLMAWAMYLSSFVFGDSVWTVRIWPILAGTAFVLVGRALAFAMFDRPTADRAGIFLALVPVFVGNGILMTPDTLFALCWAVSLYASWKALQSSTAISSPIIASEAKQSPELDCGPQYLTCGGLLRSARNDGRSAWWILAGISTGFGFLSKYNMVLFFFGLALLWTLLPSNRRQIAMGAIICALMSFVLFLPVIIWNMQNHWISFLFQLRHGFSGKPSSIFKHFGAYLGSLLLIATPVLGALAFWSSLRGIRSKELRTRFCAAFFVAVAGFFALSALKAHVETNWPMLAFFTGVILAAADWTRYAAGLRRATVVVLVLCTGSIAAYALLPAQFPLAIHGRSFDVKRMEEFIGGPELAADIQRIRTDKGLDFVYVPSHQVMGRISFYAPQLRPLLCPSANLLIRYPWIDVNRFKGQTALIVSPSDHDFKVQDDFASVEFLDTISIPYKGTLLKKFYLYTGRNYRGQPAANDSDIDAAQGN